MTDRWRRVGIALAGLAVCAAIAAIAVDVAARRAVEAWGSRAAGAPVRVESVDVSLFAPQVVMHGLVVGNPPGFPEEPALSLRRLTIDVDPASISGEPVRVREVVVDGFELRVSRSGSEHNLAAIESSVVTFLEREGDGTRVLVERLHARGGQASAPLGPGRATVPVKDMELRGIGQREGGLPPAALAAELFDLMEPSFGKALAHTDYGELLRRGARGVGAAARKLKGLFQ